MLSALLTKLFIYVVSLHIAVILLLRPAHAVPHAGHTFLGFQRNQVDQRDFLSRVRQSVPADGRRVGFSITSSDRREVLMINGTADDTFVSSFYFEDGFNATAYTFHFESNNTEIIDPNTDVSMSQTISLVYTNITSLIDFRKFPGLVQLRILAKKKDDLSVVDSMNVNFLAAGVVLYKNESREIVSGSGRSLTLDSSSITQGNQIQNLGVYVQYLNGSDSMIFHEGKLSYGANLALSDIKPTISGFEGQILWDSSACSISAGSWNTTAVSLPPGCGMGFAVGRLNDSYYDGLHFAFKLEKNRAGDFTTMFLWDTFTIESNFDDEDYTTFIYTVISGQPPAIVRRIEPGNPFSRDGEDELYVEMTNTADANITSFNAGDLSFPIIPGSHQFINGPDDFYETVKFLTKPGTGKRLQWTISASRIGKNTSELTPVAFIDETGFLFSYDDEEISITRLFPISFINSGGEEATLSGNFSSFLLNSSNHNVLIGNNFLPRENFISVTSTEIRFRIPSQKEIGPAWKYSVVVQVGNSFSNRLYMSYYSLRTRLAGLVLGASIDFNTGVYSLSSCGNTTFGVDLQEQSEEDAIFRWRLYNTSGHAVDSFNNNTRLVRDESTMEFPNNIIAEYDEIFSLNASAIIGNQTSSFSFRIKRNRTAVVGVTLIEPENRTIAFPQVDFRIISKIELPSCVPDTKSLLYEWDYEDKDATMERAEKTGLQNPSIFNTSLPPVFKRFSFSYLNNTGTSTTEITPTRLGRELIIPQHLLRHGLHRVRLTVRGNSTNTTLLFGSASTNARIDLSSLITVIGTGEVFKQVSDTEDLLISGAGSYDPDLVLPTQNSSAGIRYKWICDFSLYSNMTQTKSCGKELLPFNNLSSFTVSKQVLESKSSLALDDFEKSVFVKYTLTIIKGTQSGSASQVVAVTRSSGMRMARYDKIEIINSRSEAVNLDAVEFWDEIIIRPSGPSATQWRFRLDQPTWERATFFAGNGKLISNPGYYTSSASSDPEYQRLPLGIAAGSLSSHLTYKFSISFQETGRLRNDVSISFKTIEVPEITFPSISLNNGSTSTVFRARASTSFHSNSTFAYQFYLLDVGRKMSEYCVDGCTGANIVRFQIQRPGEYVIQCRLIAANGKTLLTARNNSRNIYVSVPEIGKTIQGYDNNTEKDFLLGDDGAVNQRGFFVSQALFEQEDEVIALSDDIVYQSCVEHIKKWAKMSRTIVRNERPNTANARNYIILASNYAKLKCVEDEETLYELLAIVDLSLARTPKYEFLSTVSHTDGENTPEVAVEEDLLRFYNFSMTRALSHVSAGTSRGRIIPVPGKVSNIVLDLSEMWMKHMTATATSGRVCGWDGTYTSGIVDGEPENMFLSQRANDSFGLSTIHVAVRCNAEHGTSLKTPSASFEWCEAVYDITGNERKLVTLAETYDFPYVSGIQGSNASDTTHVVLVDITTLSDSNQLVSALEDNQVAARAGENEESSKACYKIGMKMSPVSLNRVDECTYNIPYRMWPRKPFTQRLVTSFEDSAYQRRTAGIIATTRTRNNSDFVVAITNTLGLYGAVRSQCQEQPHGLEFSGGTLTGTIIGVLFAILLVTLLSYILVTVVIGVIARRGPAAIPPDSFVQRDFYGRADVPVNTTQISGRSLSTAIDL